MTRPERPSKRHQWCPTDKRWLSPKELGELTKDYDAHAEASGHRDIEYVDGKGRVLNGVLGGARARSANLEAYLPARDGEIPEDSYLFDYHDSVLATCCRLLEQEALRAICERQHWVTVGALSMLARGFKEREIERCMRVGRPRLRKSVAHLAGKYGIRA